MVVVPETPIEILKLINNKQLDPKALKTAPRRLCVEYLDAIGMQEVDMARLLKVHQNTIYNDVRLLHEAHGRRTLGDGFERIVGNLVSVKKVVQAKLSGQKKWKDVWVIEREFLEKLQGLGVVFRQPDELRLGEINGEDVLIGMKEKSDSVLAARLEKIRKKNKELTQPGQNG